MPFRLSLCLGQCATNRGTKGEKVLLKNEPLSFPAERTEAEGQTSGDSTWDSITAQPPSVQVRTRSGETLVSLTMDYVVPFPPPTKNGGVWERKSRPWWEHASLPARSPSATRSSGPELFSIRVRTDTLKHLLVAKTGVEMQKGENLAPSGNNQQLLFVTFPSEELRYPVVFAKMLLHPAKPDSQAAAQVPAHVALVGPTARMSRLQKSLIIIIMIILNRFTGHN